MFSKSRKTISVALMTAAAFTSATIPVSAHSARYCREHVRYEPDSGFNPVLILPLAALGAGVGAAVGAAASGISIGTGAAVGAGSGAGLGLVGGVYHTRRGYDRAYEECRAE